MIEYAHLYTPGTLGDVTLDISGGLYIYQVFVDENCDGDFGVTEGPHTAPYTFTNSSWSRLSDGRLAACAVKVRVIVPDGEADGTQEAVQVTAGLLWQSNPNGITDSRFITDTTVITEGGRLELSKEVRNLSQGSAFATTGAGSPGQVLEYRIRYRNAGSDIVTAVEFSDPVPYFSQVELNQYGAVGEVELVCPDTTVVAVDTGPVATIDVDIMTECALTEILAGEGGTLSYRVRIE